MLLFDIDRSNKATVVGDELQLIRERFSVENKAAKFGRYNSRFLPYRKYLITPKGRFDVGLYYEIVRYIKEYHPTTRYNKTAEFKQLAFPTIETPLSSTNLKLQLRDYQLAIVSACTRVGRGVVVLATAGGKTLTMAGLIQRVYDNTRVPIKFKCLVLVPDIGLVNQTFQDFMDYGVTFTVSKWSGSNKLNLNTNVVVANMGILQSKKSEIDWLSTVDLLIIDEVHKLRAGNKINKILDKVVTSNRYGFTGTMPEEQEDQWNIIGKIGPILYEKNSFQLRRENYIALAKVLVLKITYNNKPKSVYNVNFNPSDRYRTELEWLQSNTFRNKVICKVCKNTDNNCLVLVDRIEHGQLLSEQLKVACGSSKMVFFIRGEVDVATRDKVRKIMEVSTNVICVAISKIFSTGINIKNLHYIMFCAGGKAKVKIIQSIGRGLRKHDSKEQLMIVDIADQTHYGIQHANKRIKLYNSEQFKYEYQEIKEI